jgi:zinc protease
MERAFWAFPPGATPSGEIKDGLSQETVEAFVEARFAPAGLIGLMVGDIDPTAVREVLARTFGSIPATPPPPPPPPAMELATPDGMLRIEQPGEPVLEVRYRTVPRGHPDRPALEVLALLAGPLLWGRDDGGPVRGTLEQVSLRHTGYLAMRAPVDPAVGPDAMLESREAGLRVLREEPVSEEDLERARQAAGAGERWSGAGNMLALVELGRAVARAGAAWNGDDRAAYEAVTAADVQRVAARYLQPDGRVVALFAPGGPDESNDALPADLPEMLRLQLEEMARRIAQSDDPAVLRALLANFDRADPSGLSPERRVMVEFLRQAVERRLAELEP